MAGDLQTTIQVTHTATGSTLYALVRNIEGKVWNGSSFVAYVTANLGTYAIALTEQGTASRHYAANFPAVPGDGGVYYVSVFSQGGGSPAEGDTLVSGGSMFYKMYELMRLLHSTQGSKSNKVGTTRAYRDRGDTKDVVSATVDTSGNRGPVTLDLT